jgi:CheY-like chemotaxis protein/Ran GTPase-activating protein (RanGAP) involved in mRNA processing and transport
MLLGHQQIPQHIAMPPPISVINLSYAYMGNLAIDMLGEVLYMDNSMLRTLDISFCGIDERGFLLLAKALNKRQRNAIMPLRGIILSGNHISYRAATDMGRALSPDPPTNDTAGRRRRGPARPRGRSGGYDEDSESEEEDFDPDEFGFFGPKSSRKGARVGNSSSTDASAEKYFSKDHGLQVVHLGVSMDAESTAQFLQGLGPRSPVRELCLASNNIGPNGAALIVSFLEGKGMPKGKQVMPYLDRLDLSNNNLGNDGLTKLTRAISRRSGQHFVDLRLSNNAIGHGGIETIMNKLLQHNLVSLSLDKNAIGDQGCQLVAASLQSMSCLSRLNLAFNQIGSRGVNSLMRALVACESVTYLALSGNIMKISGAVALAFTLAQHPRLEELNVDNCCLSQAAQCHIIAGIISNRWVPMKKMNGFEAQPPMVAIGAIKMVSQTLSNEECFRLRKDEQMKTILQWMESNRVAKKMAGGAGMPGASSEAYQHFLTPDYVQSMNDVYGIPSQNPYLRLLGWLSRIPFDEDELIALRKYFYDSDGGSEDRGSDGYINLKLRGDLLAALESEVADEIRDDTPMLFQYAGSVGLDLDALLDKEQEVSTESSWGYMKGMHFDNTQRIVADMIPEEDDAPSDDDFNHGSVGDNDGDSDEDLIMRKKHMYSSDQQMNEYAMSHGSMSGRNSMSSISRASLRSMNHSGSERSNVSQGERDRRRAGGLKARITMFPQFEFKLEELKATATDMIEQEEDPEQQEVILTQYAEASLTILRQLRYHCMNSGLDGWRQGSMKRKVLIVDDSGVTRKLVSRAFEKAGFIVDTASNGKEGVQKLKKSIYDIAFMDIDMPVMNGFEATKQLRQWEDLVRPGTRQPICALTAAYVDDFERSELMKFKEAGLDVMESKPCNIPRLFKVVDDVSPMFSDLSLNAMQQER